MKALGVISFIIGVTALGVLAVRRGRDLPLQWQDIV